MRMRFSEFQIEKYKIKPNLNWGRVSAFDGRFIFLEELIRDTAFYYSLDILEILYCFFEERPEINVEVDVFITHVSRDILNLQIKTSNGQKVLKNLYFWYPREKELDYG